MKTSPHVVLVATLGLAALGQVQYAPADVASSKLPVASNFKVDRKVFAHYMVCCPTVGGGATLEDLKNEIREAQKRGIDGFALNCGNWAVKEPYYKARTKLMYRAAKELGTGFQLFVSADQNALHEIPDIVETLKDEPNQFRYHGKFVLSTFGGQGDDTKAGGYRLTKQIDDLYGTGEKRTITFVPYFYPRPNISELPDQSHVDQVFNDFPSLDGFFYFGAAGSPEQIVHSDTLLAKKWLGAGKVYMSGITPYYRANGGNYRLFETRGFEGMQQEWLNAIKNGSTWVELVTWNDWNESSYLSPFGPPSKTEFWKGHFGPMMLSHQGYLDASKYYIQWFKTGVPPKIEKDELYYFYRLHPKALDAVKDPSKADAGLGRPDHADSLHDKVYVTLFLTQPARLTIYSGNTKQEFELAAGVQDVSMPFGFGAQRFVLTRRRRTLIDRTGEFEISATDTASRFNYFSGGATAE